MGLSFIPTTAIVNWLRLVDGERNPDEIRRTVNMVRAIDSEFLAVQKTKTPVAPTRTDSDSHGSRHKQRRPGSRH